jgi:hypothetical protein
MREYVLNQIAVIAAPLTVMTFTLVLLLAAQEILRLRKL